MKVDDSIKFNFINSELNRLLDGLHINITVDNMAFKDIWYPTLKGDKIAYLRERDTTEFIFSKKHKEFFDQKCQIMKPGKFLTKAGITDKSKIEALIGALRPPEFVLLDGEFIPWVYKAKNYAPNNGSLNSSCMRYNSSSMALELFKGNVKILVALKNKKVIGRALVWENLEHPEKPSIPVYMDRVYGLEATQENFRAFAFEHNWTVKLRQNYNNSNGLSKNSESFSLEGYKVKLQKPYTFTDAKPYLDTFDGYTIKGQKITHLEAYADLILKEKLRDLYHGPLYVPKCAECGSISVSGGTLCSSCLPIYKEGTKSFFKKCSYCGELYKPTYFGEKHRDCYPERLYKCKEHNIWHIAKTKKEFKNKSCGGFYDSVLYNA